MRKNNSCHPERSEGSLNLNKYLTGFFGRFTPSE